MGTPAPGPGRHNGGCTSPERGRTLGGATNRSWQHDTSAGPRSPRTPKIMETWELGGTRDRDVRKEAPRLRSASPCEAMVGRRPCLSAFVAIRSIVRGEIIGTLRMPGPGASWTAGRREMDSPAAHDLGLRGGGGPTGCRGRRWTPRGGVRWRAGGGRRGGGEKKSRGGRCLFFLREPFS